MNIKISLIKMIYCYFSNFQCMYLENQPINQSSTICEKHCSAQSSNNGFEVKYCQCDPDGPTTCTCICCAGGCPRLGLL